MIAQIVAYLQARAKAAALRAAVSTASLLVAGVFGLAAVAGLFVALFFWVAQLIGPVFAGLVCFGAGILLSIVSLAPLMIVMLTRRRRAPPPPPAPTLPDFVSLVAKSAPGLGPRQLVVTAALLGMAIALSARRRRK